MKKYKLIITAHRNSFEVYERVKCYKRTFFFFYRLVRQMPYEYTRRMGLKEDAKIKFYRNLLDERLTTFNTKVVDKTFESVTYE